jgi:hypothetical protein
MGAMAASPLTQILPVTFQRRPETACWFRLFCTETKVSLKGFSARGILHGQIVHHTILRKQHNWNRCIPDARRWGDNLRSYARYESHSGSPDLAQWRTMALPIGANIVGASPALYLIKGTDLDSEMLCSVRKTRGWTESRKSVLLGCLFVGFCVTSV